MVILELSLGMRQAIRSKFLLLWLFVWVWLKLILLLIKVMMENH